MHVHLVFVAKYRRKIVELDAIESHAATLPAYALILMLNGLRWTANANTYIC